jgi:hypothetical protein
MLSRAVAPRASVEAMLTMRGLCDRRRKGSAPRVRGQQDRQHPLPLGLVAGIVDTAEARHTGIVDHHVETAEMAGDLGNQPLDHLRVAHVEGPAPRLAAFGADVGRHRLGVFRPYVGHRHSGAFPRKDVGGGAPHAAGGAGDQDDLAGHRAAEVGDGVHGMFLSDYAPSSAAPHEPAKIALGRLVQGPAAAWM